MRTHWPVYGLLLALASPAAAQQAPTACPQHAGSNLTPAVMAARRAEHQACAADMARLCANVPKGCGRPMQCLRSHMGELSGACTTAMAQLHAARMQPH